MGHVEAILGHSCCEGQDLGPWQPGGAGEQGVEEVLGGKEGSWGEGGSWEGESWQGKGILGGGVGKGRIQEGRRRPPKEGCRQGPLVSGGGSLPAIELVSFM